MEELKLQAEKLGLEFKGNISKAELTTLIENATAEDSVKEVKNDKIKVIITPRDSEEKEGYVGLSGYTAQYAFEEEIELPVNVVKFLKTRGGYIYDAKGKKKWVSRFLIETI